MAFTFNQALVETIYDQLVSHAERLGTFGAGVQPAEPWSAPGDGVWCFFAAPAIAPVAAASGLASITGRLEFKVILGTDLRQRPAGRADKAVTVAAGTLIAEYSGNFTLSGNVRNVDLLGQHGAPLGGAPAYMEADERKYRVYEVTLPLIVSDLWTEAA